MKVRCMKVDQRIWFLLERIQVTKHLCNNWLSVADPWLSTFISSFVFKILQIFNWKTTEKIDYYGLSNSDRFWSQTIYLILISFSNLMQLLLMTIVKLSILLYYVSNYACMWLILQCNTLSFYRIYLSNLHF